jgi:hypothetical protein
LKNSKRNKTDDNDFFEPVQKEPPRLGRHGYDWDRALEIVRKANGKWMMIREAKNVHAISQATALLKKTHRDFEFCSRKCCIYSRYIGEMKNNGHTTKG